jgi:hypothetical protein
MREIEILERKTMGAGVGSMYSEKNGMYFSERNSNHKDIKIPEA